MPATATVAGVPKTPLAAAKKQPAPSSKRNTAVLASAAAFVLLAVIVTDAVQYADTDLWGHVRFGQIMLRTGYLIRADIFSYSAAGRPWIRRWLKPSAARG